jgi:hypothetical protein
MPAHLISLLANLALTLSLIVAIIFGIAQIRAANRARKERLTIETLQNFQSREFAAMMLFTSSIEFPRNLAAWDQWPDESKEKFMQLMQQMESLGILLADGLIDLGLVDKILGKFVSHTWGKFKPIVLELRQKNPDPYLAEHFQWMAEQIENSMKNHPRKPFYKMEKKLV